MSDEPERRPVISVKPSAISDAKGGRSHTRLFAFYALLPLVACGQLWALLELLGLRLPPHLVFGLEGVVIAACLFYASRRRAVTDAEDSELGRWWLIGLGMFCIWAVLYFAAGRFTEPMQARTFDDAILERLPLMPQFAPIYLGVHVFGIIPFCVIPEQRLLRRHLLGAVLIVTLSAIAWVSLPVRLDRPEIDPSITGFGAYLLRWVHSFDPTTNCFPSAHCAIAVYAAIGLRFSRSRRLFIWGIITATLICISTVMTRQHYVADVASGAVLAALAAFGTQRKQRSLPFDR